MGNPQLVLIAAVARNRVIGKNNQLVWTDPLDMAHFRETTRGHAVLMGRKTWESLPPRFRPLPGRRNLVLTRQADYAAPGAECYATLEAALAACTQDETVFVMGGAEIYAQALPLASRLELTEVDLSPEGDAWFPDFSGQGWQAGQASPQISDAGVRFAFIPYTRS